MDRPDTTRPIPRRRRLVRAAAAIGLSGACLCVADAASSRSLVGREFLFAWPETPDVTDDDATYDLDAEVILLAASEPLEVRVTAPGIDRVVPVSPGSPARVRLDRALVMVSTEDVPVARAVHLESTSCATFGALLRAPASGASVGDDVARLLPIEALGRRYLPMAYRLESAYVVTATRDGTTVSWTDPDCGRAGSVVLDRGEALLRRCDGDVANEEITGSRVVADAPISVVSVSVSKVPFSQGTDFQRFFEWTDLLLGSPWPTEAFGVEHAHAPFRKVNPVAAGDLVRFQGSCPGTSVVATESDGDEWPLSVGAEGDFEDTVEFFDAAPFTRLANGAVLTSGAPHQAAAFMPGHQDALIGDPSMTILDPRDAWEREAIAYLPSGYTSSIAVVTTAADVGLVELDGAPWSGSWASVAPGSDLSWSRLDDVAAGEHRVTSDAPIFVELSGYGVLSSDVFAGGWSEAAIPVGPNAEPTLTVAGLDGCTPSCPGDCFDASIPLEGGEATWSDGSMGTTVATCPVAEELEVEHWSDDGCRSRGVATTPLVDAPPPPEITGAASSCPDECVTLTGGAAWDERTWSTGGTGTETEVCPADDVVVTLEVAHSSGCTATAEHAIVVHHPPVAGAVAVEAIDECRRGLSVTWEEATWPDGAPGTYNVYRTEGACAAAGDPTWELVALGLTGTSWLDSDAAVETPYSYRVEAETPADGAGACRPGPAGGSTDSACGAPEGIVDPGEPDAALLVSFSPHLRATGYERPAPLARPTTVMFAWPDAPETDPATHVEAWRSDRPDALAQRDVAVAGRTWRDDDVRVAPLLFYRLYNATECGTLGP